MALKLFGDVYAGRRVLVTGHTGFKGSWLALWLQALGAEVAGLALDPDTQPSHWPLLHLGDITDHRVNLLDAAGVRKVVAEHEPEVVFHLAAQSLVRRSYADPVGTFGTNVMGLVNLFEAVRGCASVRVIINATTDKVYADHGYSDGYHETDPLGGHDPYSSSKACAELVSDSYRKSFFGANASVRVATARAGNVIGGGDWGEDRLVPDLVRAATSGAALRIRNPSAVRPWQHVLEPLSGYLRLGQLLWDDPGFVGAWNFGPDTSGDISVQVLAQRLGQHWPALNIQHDHDQHPHEAATLRLNCDKAKERIAWCPVWNMDTTLLRTARWYRSFYEDHKIETDGDLASYIEDARSLGLAWA